MASVLDIGSVEAKIGRAVEHFNVLDASIQTWIDSGHYTFVAETNSKKTRHCIVALEHGSKPSYEHWTLIVGDIINNLRCALDHLIYSVAKYQTINHPTANIDSLAFVIADCPAKFKEGERRLRWLSPAVVSAIESLQPYKRMHPALPPLLGILRDFSNADKHRLLRLASGGTTSGDLKFQTTTPAKPIPYWNPDEVEDNAIILMVETAEPDPHFRFDPSTRIGMEICLWHGLRAGETNPLGQRTGYSVLLPWLMEEVRFAVDLVAQATVG